MAVILCWPVSATTRSTAPGHLIAAAIRLMAAAVAITSVTNESMEVPSCWCSSLALRQAPFSASIPSQRALLRLVVSTRTSLPALTDQASSINSAASTTACASAKATTGWCSLAQPIQASAPQSTLLAVPETCSITPASAKPTQYWSASPATVVAIQLHSLPASPSRFRNSKMPKELAVVCPLQPLLAPMASFRTLRVSSVATAATRSWALPPTTS